MNSEDNSSTSKRLAGWWNPSNWPLLAKLLLPTILVVALGAAVSSTVAIESVRTTLQEQVGNGLVSHAADLGGQTRGFLREPVAQLQTMALLDQVVETVNQRNEDYEALDGAVQAELQRLDSTWINAADNDPLIVQTITADKTINPLANQLHDFLRAFPYHSEVFITDRLGGTVASTERLSDYYQADEDWWQAAWNDGAGAVYISDPEFDESAGVTALLIAVPIYQEQTGNVVGIVRTTLDVQALFALLDGWELGETGHAMLLNQEGELIYDPHPEGLAPELRRELVANERGYQLTGSEIGTELLLGYEKLQADDVAISASRWLAQSEQAIANLNWTIVVHQDSEEALTAVSIIGRSVGYVNVLIILLIGAAVYIVARSVVKPVRQLDQIVNEVAQGRLDVEIPVTRRDEVGRLAQNFGVMLQRQQETLVELARRTRAVETTAEVSRSLSTYLDTQALATAVVDQVQHAFDYYHAHIYLLDESRRNLVMMAGTGEAGAAMLRNRHQIPVGKGLVGRTAATLTAILVPDVSQEAGWLPNPLLPQTRAEIAVPITIGKELIGVLDVQHNVVNGLQETDLELLGTVAGQVALAFRNAQAFEQARARAEQATMINQISQKIENSATIEGVLDVAARELRDAFGAQRTIVELAAKVGR